MVRPGPVVSQLAAPGLMLGPALLLVMAGALATPVGSPSTDTPASKGPAPPAVPDSSAASPAGKPRGGEAESIERQPYKIRAWIVVAPGVRVDGKARSTLITAWRSLVRRFVGAVWDLEVAEGDGPLATTTLEDLRPQDIAPMAQGFDKAWVLQIEPAPEGGAGTMLSGREFDGLTTLLGSTLRRPAPYPADTARALLGLTLDLFVPTAEIGPKSGGGVLLTVRGAALPAASAIGQIVKAGSVFRPLRVFLRNDGSPLQIAEIRRSFLRVISVEGAVARCDIVSSLRDPLSSRVVRKNKLVALGVKPTSMPNRYRYVYQPDPSKPKERAPAAGYILTAQSVPDGSPRRVGMTDREGRAVLDPKFADGLVILRLLAAELEPLDEFPAMPGEAVEERTVLIRLKPDAVALETQLYALRDELVDLVAVRARIEARLKARAEGEKWDEVEALLKEFRALPPRDDYVNRLTKLKDEAAHKQAELRTAILTKTAQNLVTETQSLIDRYLDDEIFKAYSEALASHNADAAKGKAKAPAQPKADMAAKSAPTPASAPPPAKPGPAAPAAVTPRPKATVPF